MGDILDSSRYYTYQSTHTRYKKVQQVLSIRLLQRLFTRWKRSCYMMVVMHSKSSQTEEVVTNFDSYQAAAVISSSGRVSSTGGTMSTEILSPQYFTSPSPLRPPPPPPITPPMPSSGLSLIPVAKGTTQFSSSVIKKLRRRGNFIDGSAASSSFKSRQLLPNQQGASTFLLPSIETLNFVESLPLPLSESTSPIPVVDLTYFTTPSGRKQPPLTSPDFESGTLSGSTTLATMTHTSCTTAPYTPLATHHYTRPKGSPSNQQPLLLQQQQQQQQLFEADSHATSREYLVDQIFKYWSALAQQPETLGSESYATHLNTDSSKCIVMSIAVKKWLKYARNKHLQRKHTKQIDDSHMHKQLKIGYLQIRKFVYIITTVPGSPQTIPKRDQRRLADNFQPRFGSRKAFRRILSFIESRKMSNGHASTSLLAWLYLCFQRFRVRLAHHSARVTLAKGSISIQRLGYLSQVKRALRALAANVRFTSNERVDAVVFANGPSASLYNENLDSFIVDASRVEDDSAMVISSLSGSEVDLTFSSIGVVDNPCLLYGVKNETAEVCEIENPSGGSIKSRHYADNNAHSNADKDTVDENTGQKSGRLNITSAEKGNAQHSDIVVRSSLGSHRDAVGVAVSVSRYVRVLWDIENVQVPKRVSGLTLVESLQKTLSAHPPHPLCGPGVDLRITAFLRPNESNSSEDLLHQLDLAAVEMVLVAKKREDADRKLGVRIQQEMQVLRPDVTTFVLISSDTDFRHHLQLLKNNGFEVIVIHNIRTDLVEHSSWRQTFEMHASRCYRWKDIVDTARQQADENRRILNLDDGMCDDANQATTTGMAIDGDEEPIVEVSRVDISGINTISNRGGSGGQGSTAFYCGVCKKSCNSRNQLDAHNSSAKHLAKCVSEGDSPNSNKGMRRGRKKKATKDTLILEGGGGGDGGGGDGVEESPCSNSKNDKLNTSNMSDGIAVDATLLTTLSGSEYNSILSPSPNPTQLDVSTASIEKQPTVLPASVQKSQSISQDSNDNNETAGSLSSSNIHVLWESHSPLWKRAVAFYSHVRKVSALFTFLKHTTLSRIRKERDGHLWQRWRRRKLRLFMQRFKSVYRARSQWSYSRHFINESVSDRGVRFDDSYKGNVLLDRKGDDKAGGDEKKDDEAFKVGIASSRDRLGYHIGVSNSTDSGGIISSSSSSSNINTVNGEILKNKVRSEPESSPYQRKSVSKEASHQATRLRHTLL